MNNCKELYNDIKSIFERERQGKIENLKVLKEQIIVLRSDLRNNKDEGNNLNTSIANLVEESKNYRDQLGKKQKQTLNHDKEIIDLKKIIDDCKEQNENKQMKIEKFEQDINELDTFAGW